ncbi:MAG TPA: hypothetical protein VGP77_09430 [Vicinamibacterales bacterium]|jgi:uncharacterized protein (DUF885 family)|nr:hypothetical protein [Vicinamibacterales bacterium]
MRGFVSILLCALLLLPAVSQAQTQSDHAASLAALDDALQQHESAIATDRQDVLRVLDKAEVKAVAGRVGVDLRTARSAVATLDPRDLAPIAAQARQVDQALAGGASTVTISTTTIIIALLVVILLIVAID